MTAVDKSQAYSTLGLAPGASQAEIDNAHKRLVAFWDSDDVKLAGLKDAAWKDIDAARKLLLSSLTSSPQGTVSGGTTSKPVKSPGGKGGGWIWLAVLVLAGGIILDQQKKKDTPPKTIVNPPPGPGGQQSPGPTGEQPQQPSGPPTWAEKFIHKELKDDQSLIWSSGNESINAGNYLVVTAKNSQGRLVNRILMYQDGADWREFQQYIVRYGSDQIAVQRFKERGGGAPEMKDQSNVSDVGDVLVQTTFYMYSSGALDRVVVDTPFVKASRSLVFHRDGGSISVEEVPGGPIRIAPESAGLNNVYDLFSVFGEPG